MAITEFRGEYRFLSNFWPVPAWHGRTVEHFFASRKTTDAELRAWILASDSPATAKRRGREVPLRADWDAVKDEVMRACLAKKFADADLAERLLATMPEDLVEGNTWGDRYWGVCAGSGENRLGRLLMELRDELWPGGES